MRKKKALILGVTGQDGSFMAKLLLNKKYIVHGLIRKSATGNLKNISDILNTKSFFIEHGDLLDTISLIGISFEIDKSNLVNQSKKYVFIDIDKSAVKDTLLLIDSYLKDKYRIYEPYIKNSIIKVRKHKNYTVETGEKLYISINNIRTKGILSKVQLFTI